MKFNNWQILPLLAPLVAIMALMAVPATIAPIDADLSASGPVSAEAVDPPAVPDAGAVAYRAGDYQQAQTLWRAELDQLSGQASKGEQIGQLCYNLGNAAYRSKQGMQALAWYTAARRYLPRDEDLLANLKFVRGELALPPEHSSGLLATLSESLRSWTLPESKNMALVGVLLLLLALGYEALRGGKQGRTLALVGFSLCALLWLPFLRHTLAGDPPSHMVIAARGTNARSEPRPDAKSLLRLEPTATADRLDEWGEWTKLRAETGEEVWVTTKKVMPIRW